LQFSQGWLGIVRRNFTHLRTYRY